LKRIVLTVVGFNSFSFNDFNCCCKQQKCWRKKETLNCLRDTQISGFAVFLYISFFLFWIRDQPQQISFFHFFFFRLNSSARLSLHTKDFFCAILLFKRDWICIYFLPLSKWRFYGSREYRYQLIIHIFCSLPWISHIHQYSNCTFSYAPWRSLFEV
jgi:hypothetical protein